MSDAICGGNREKVSEQGPVGRGVMGRASRPASTSKKHKKGVRAVVQDKPIEPEGVKKYLTEKFSTELQTVKKAMEFLVKTFKPEELNKIAFSLYERFRPEIPAGVSGWGVKGKLNLNLIRSLAKKARE